MNTTQKTLVIVFALLIFTSIVTVGCKARQNDDLVNTNKMPGKKFSKYLPADNGKKTKSRVVYLGDDNKTSDGSNFGPRDVSFDFYSLKAN